MNKATIQRPCPRCCPAGLADYDYQWEVEGGRKLYTCRNCGDQYRARTRPARAGGPAQRRALDRLRAAAGDRYHAEESELVGGAVILALRGKSWMRGSALAVVGPRGAVELTIRPACGDKVERRGAVAFWAAETWLS